MHASKLAHEESLIFVDSVSSTTPPSKPVISATSTGPASEDERVQITREPFVTSGQLPLFDSRAMSTIASTRRSEPTYSTRSSTEPEEPNIGKSSKPVRETVTVGDTDEGTTTSTIITTTIITTAPSHAPCSSNFTGLQGYIESPKFTSLQYYNSLDCVSAVTVYMGFGVEIQVLNVSLSEGEMLTIEDVGVREPNVIANESILMKGLVLRSSSNQVAIHFQSYQLSNPGYYHFRYQAYILSCGFPQRPTYGDVSVTSLHPGGEAYFYCHSGYQLQGASSLMCLNATTPFWNGKGPQCLAVCGGFMRNATVGRIISPGFPSNYSNNLTCHWVIEAPEGQRLHLHFEKVALAEDDDRLLIKNGNNIDSPPVYDSYEVEYLPIEGIVSGSRWFFIELTTDSTGASTGVALRYEAFSRGHCYEPFVKYGNFTTSDALYPVGTVVEFTCDPGYTLEQGSVIIECMDITDPQWNETEPACRAVCSGEITDSAGVVLSPNWPEAYDKGQDCIWGIHVEEDKRIMLDIQVLHISKSDVLTFYDGDDLTARILGQYAGTHRRFKLFTSMADVTIQFQSDPASNVFGYQNGFIIHFFEVPRNDTCPELPEISNGWKTTSHPELIHGTVVTYQCYPGFDLQGTEILMCQWDLTWSGDLPSCMKVTTCPDPGEVDHSRRVMSNPKLTAGTTVQYICNKGYALSGNSLLTCYSRDAGSPKWSERLPKCSPEVYEPCHNPGAPSFSIQTTEKRFYQPGEMLRFSCYNGYQLVGESVLRCIPGHPSQWSSPPPVCQVSNPEYLNERQLDVAKASVHDPLEKSGTVMAILIPITIIVLAVAGLYVYFSKVQRKTFRLHLPSSHPYNHITVESAFDNPIYETGESREYEVSI
uniref:Seizure related 6 homolog n=1 Tax=Erpetoichthys calabaricus TaxID=27687 RepID=A0A8C4RZZ3_ERPCA